MDRSGCAQWVRYSGANWLLPGEAGLAPWPWSQPGEGSGQHVCEWHVLDCLGQIMAPLWALI